VLSGHTGNDTLHAGPGADKAYGNDDDDIITGHTGNDILSGGNGTDTVHGGDGDDRLYGYGGNDKLYGEAGNDWADGGEGDDTCKAETELNCLQLAPPEWVDGDEIIEESVSRFDFRISWPAFTDPTDELILTITADGVTQTEYIDITRYSDWEVNSFQGFALEEGKIYSLTLSASNSAGTSRALKRKIGIPKLVVTTTADVDKAFAVAPAPADAKELAEKAPSSRHAKAQLRGACSTIAITAIIAWEIPLIDDPDGAVYDISNYVCFDGTNFNTNDNVGNHCEPANPFSDVVLDIEVREPTLTKGNPKAFSNWRCDVETVGIWKLRLDGFATIDLEIFWGFAPSLGHDWILYRPKVKPVQG